MNKLLVVVDMQNDFCKPEGVLYNPEAEKITPNIKGRVVEYFENSDLIVATKDTHEKGEFESTIEGKALPLHCEYRTWGNKIVDELRPYIKGCSADKDTFMLLTDAGWLDTLYTIIDGLEDEGVAPDTLPNVYGNNPFEEIEICGVCTDICVISNALYLRSCFPRTRITVRANCCAGVTKESHEAALKVMESCMINVIRD